MRVLVLSYHLPPDPAVGSLRVKRVIDAFRRAGHDVEAIGPRLSAFGAETLVDIRVHRVRRFSNAREIALDIRRRLRRTTSADAGASPAGGYVTPPDVPGWKRFLIAMALMPDDQQGFILPAVARAMRLMATRRFDLLYTSGPPHSAHVCGLLLKTLTRIRWTAEFRDPWTGNVTRTPRARSRTAFALKRWIERRALAAADRIVAVSESAGIAFAANVSNPSMRVIVARNGIDEMASAAPKARDVGPLRVLYLGNLYGARDPMPFINAVASLIEHDEGAAHRIRIDFYGECRWYRDVDVPREAERLGLAGMFRLHGHVPHAEAMRLACSADLLLLLAQDQPLQVPNKLYDYLGARRPIIAFADAHGETATMLEQVGGHFLISTDDDERVRAVVSEALRVRGWTPTASADAIMASWSARRQMDRLVHVLGGPGSANGRGRRIGD